MPLITVFRREVQMKKCYFLPVLRCLDPGSESYTLPGAISIPYLVPILDFDRRYTLFIPGSRELCLFDDLSGAVGMFRDSDPDPATQKLLRIQAEPDPYP
jgi:hypothetical protein